MFPSYSHYTFVSTINQKIIYIMKKLSLILVASVLFAGVSFANPVVKAKKQDKPKTEKKEKKGKEKKEKKEKKADKKADKK